MPLLTKQQIIDADDLETVEVEVPEWGGSVLVRPLTAKQRGQFTATLVDQRQGGRTLRLQDIQIRLCGLSIVDQDGKRMFSDTELAILGGKSSAALQHVFEVAQRLSGLSEEQVEELAGNSDETPSEDSLSD
jgi:hypothetical protein